ncbi:7-carboxy-7-deazaguanine synthase QueE [Cyanobacterium stanieri LEGE 03274]|uniref:7-carboxy-7-deazaguanine synthase n=1 Tax=Cyanobacterium stanieri LEGE 03274 TaxID=1828756 RepID=A0ABR9V2F6_9CHRO|nr:7-carboxy-7-deazaguanine synthase QueE [Cyanobacterium stanieri]MBE9221731.1 7-carboxy-7-deazaguanine synthase QueE [Cyanobacterium stanieri LEGE 03274]
MPNTISEQYTKNIKNSHLLYTYPVVETFHSVQGEGFFAGVNAFFIRLAGCDVFCPWCDQKETWSMKKYPLFTVEEIIKKVEKIKTNIIIITGGEPLLHNLNPLTIELRKTGKNIHLETSGAHPFSGVFDWVTFSPKPYKTPHETIYRHASELKVVIGNEKDFLWALSEGEKVSSHTIKYLQPEWNSPDAQGLIFDYIKDNPSWRLSLQTHKYLGVR